jgi:hypothetical protein
MRAIPSSLMLALGLWSGAAGAAPQDKEPSTVQVHGIRNPETHTYRAIVAGLDTFDAQHALAPGVPQLLFQARSRSGKPLTEDLLQGAPGKDPLSAALSGNGDYALSLALDGEGRFQVPRSRPALDADAELRLSKKQSEVRIWPYVRSPGLADNQRRLGDLRLECQVFVAIAKKEAPLPVVLLGNAVMRGGDWCAAMKNKENTWTVSMPSRIAAAVLRDGVRNTALHVRGQSFNVPVGDTSWSNDAIVDVAFIADGTPTTTTSKASPP